MRKNNLGIEFLRFDLLGFIGIDGQINEMGTHGGDPRVIETALGHDTADDGIFIALWDITTGDHHVVQEESGVRAVLAHVGEFFLGERGMHPVWLDNRNQGVFGGVELGKVNGHGHDMAESREVWEFSLGLVDDRVAAMFFERGCELIRQMLDTD